MLTIDKPVFKATVKVNTAAIKGDFPAEFEALPTDELAVLDSGEPQAWKALLERVVVGFGPVEVCGEKLSGKADGDLAKLIRWPGVGQAMLRAYYDGLWGAAEGN